MKDLIRIDSRSHVSKYKQIIDSISTAIEEGQLIRGDQIPSINQLCENTDLARGTITKAYCELRALGIIASKHGKGYYVASTDTRSKLNIFLLFDELNAYKEILYNSFKQALEEKAAISIFFHHHNLKLFESLINDNLGNYSHYVIMPHFNEDVSGLVQKIPADKLLIIDKNIPNLTGDYSAIYQDFEADINKALESVGEVLPSYSRLNLVLSKKSFQFVPNGIVEGFQKFCRQNALPYQLLDDLSDDQIKSGEAYIIFRDADLIRLIKYCDANRLQIGRDLGIISYDDTPMKEVVAQGITVISTDFEYMGRYAATLIQQAKKEKIANPTSLIRRKSL